MPNTDTALVILAGGLGARFGGAKQIEPFGAEGRFLFEYACYDAMQAGFQKVFVIIRPGMQAIVAEQLNKWIQPARYELIVQEQSRPKPWGTAHALHFLCGKWDGSFLVLNADDYYGKSVMKRAFSYFQEEHEAHGLMSYALSDTLSDFGGVSRGLCTSDGHGFLTNILECHGITKKDDGIHCPEVLHLTESDRVSMNLWFFQEHILPNLDSRIIL